MKLTKDNYICGHCKELKQLVIVRGRAWLCKDCYEEYLAKRRAVRELNKIANEIIRGE